MTRAPEIGAQLPSRSTASHRAVASGLVAPTIVALLVTLPIGVLIANTPGLDRSGSLAVWFSILAGAGIWTAAGAWGMRRWTTASRSALPPTPDLVSAADEDTRRIAAVVRNTTNAVVMTDTLGRIVWCNAAFERVSGYRLAEALGQRPGVLLQCADTDPGTIAKIRAAIRRCESVAVEILNQDRVGRRYWIALQIEPYSDDAAQHVGFMAIQSDITESVRLREQHRAVVEAMAAGVVVQDLNGTIVDCNPAACRMLGLDAAQLRGRNSVDPRWAAIREDGSLLPGDQHAAMVSLRSGEAIDNAVMGVVTAQGERRWLEVNTRVLDLGGGRGRSVVASFNDVTLRKSIETELIFERARLAAALDGTGAGAWHWSVPAGVVAVDERWSEIVGIPGSTVTLVPIGEWMRRLHPDDAEIAAEAAALHFCGISERFSAELRVRNHAGRYVWVHCRGRLTERNPDGSPGSMFGTLMDISARKEAAAAAAAEQFKLKRLFELAPLGIALASDVDGRVLDCNQSLCEILRIERSALIGRNLIELTPADGRKAWEHHNAAFQHSGRVGPYEKEYLRGDGSRVAAVVSAQRVPLTDSEAGGAIWVIVQDISERKAMEEGLQREARTDKLTGLANRAALMDQLESTVARARADARAGFGLLFLDFDRFKLVNDTLGHDAGDDLLRQIADRLRHVLRGPVGGEFERSFVARIGGDEFVVLVDGTADLVEIERMAHRLLESLASPYAIRGSEVQSSASIGVVSSAQAELDASAMLRNADTAMYEAKRRGRGVAVVFDEGMHARVRREVEIERSLRRAIVAGEVSLVYQPIIDLDSGEMSSVEALLRWHSAELGEVSPTEFIPIAEESGAIIALGEWVLREACAEFAQWAIAHPGSKATISVNLSRVQLGQPEHLLACIERTLDACGLAPERLQLEVTERDVMRDPTAVLVLMRHLRAIGVRLAMDDFGTGTSSLACLRDYPFDVIKIDRAFVGDLDSNAQVMALVHATMMLIENLGMTSVAEGVETRAQAAILQSVGCRLGQGWLFGMPAGLSAL